MNNSIVLPLIITLFAGMSTLLGGFITFFVKRDNLKALSVALGFSAGVMVYVSLNELMAEAPEMLSAFYNPTMSKVFCFFGICHRYWYCYFNRLLGARPY